MVADDVDYKNTSWPEPGRKREHPDLLQRGAGDIGAKLI
jgi:hypothetical protein